MAAPPQILRRALCYVPGSSPRMLTKARSLAADNVTYDLEDSVTLSQKPAARAHIAAALALGRPAGVREVAVRINAVTSGLVEADLKAAMSAGALDAVVVPKVNAAADVKFVEDVLAAAGPAFAATKVVALIESARAVMDIRSICGASTGRLSGLVFAAEDFAADLSLTRTPGLQEFLLARQTVVAAARAYGMPSAIDLVCTAYKDPEVLERECADGAAMGFTGKQVIHPAQIEIVQRVFRPRLERVREAVRVLVAERKAEERGWGSWGLEGRMVDAPVIVAARGVVERAQLAGIEVGGMWKEEEGTEPEGHGEAR
ncbi:citrate lyase subunit beta-like protein [Geopyxis carbonaria]|nr:citrate lyase subunit beta-like protein [Geopyxis carbonaria]